MPHPKNKKQRIITAGDDDASLTEASAGDDGLSTELLANIFGFLDGPEDIMQKRGVCKKWKEAVKITIVPLTDFRVCSVEKHNAVNVMARAMPKLQQIKLGNIGYHHKWSDGEDPDEERAARTANFSSHDTEIISNFCKLRILEISGGWNGRYPFLFNSFPLLQKLSIKYCNYIKWNLEMLTGFPLLKELECWNNHRLTGNINSLRVLKDTLEKVKIHDCPVEGNFIDLANFPQLKELNLLYTAVKGDIRDIGEHDFSSLEELALPIGVYGGRGHEFQRISDAPDVIRAVYLLKKQRPSLPIPETWYATLSGDSPDWYDSADDETPPFYICFVEAGSRIGYRWETNHDSPCEVNWLDPEPDRDSSDYGKYIEALRNMTEPEMYRGFHEPPSEEEYNRLYEEYNNRWS